MREPYFIEQPKWAPRPRALRLTGTRGCAGIVGKNDKDEPIFCGKTISANKPYCLACAQKNGYVK